MNTILLYSTSLAGISRSTTVTVAYMMTISDLNWYDCLRVVRHIRSVAMPNYGFQKQLQEYEHTTLNEVGIFVNNIHCCYWDIPMAYVHCSTKLLLSQTVFFLHLSHLYDKNKKTKKEEEEIVKYACQDWLHSINIEIGTRY